MSRPAEVSGRDARRPVLDWNVKRRWVHIDNVDEALAHVFEAARLGWLGALRRDGQRLSDGRALFWMARSGRVRTYFTLFPFERFAELDERSRTGEETARLVGPEAVEAYDAGDVALVPPHTSEIWIRDETYDFVSPGAGVGLTEVTAVVATMEVRQEQLGSGAHIESLWKETARVLEEQRYPLSCRSFFSAFGTGRVVRLWLAGSQQAFTTAPDLRQALSAGVGAERASALLDELERVFPVLERVQVERRPDLSNLGPAD